MEVIADYQDLCGECPVWDPETGTLYWTDNSGHRFYRYRPATGVHAVVNDTLEICGFRLNAGGGFTLINRGGIWLWDGAGAPRLLASEVDGARLKLNDCTADAAGRLLAGSNFYAPGGDYERGKLIRVDTDLRVSVLDEGFELSNGIAFSPDSTTLYFTDSTARRIYAYDYDLATGAARNRRVLVAVPPDEGLPDGLSGRALRPRRHSGTPHPHTGQADLLRHFRGRRSGRSLHHLGCPLRAHAGDAPRLRRHERPLRRRAVPHPPRRARPARVPHAPGVTDR